MSNRPLCADTHCHLDDKAYSEDLTDVIGRARADGIYPIITPAENLESSTILYELSKNHNGLFPCVGHHPHVAADFNDADKNSYQTLAGKEEIIAIGEIGLDYFYDKSPKEKQNEVLEYFLGLAAETGKPACIHIRDKAGKDDAYNDVHRLLKPHIGKFPAVVHCFTGSKENAKMMLDTGMYLSFTGIITFKNSYVLRDIFSSVPTDRIMLETDGPYLTPVPHRGKRNEPAYLKFTFETAAETLNINQDKLSDILAENQKQFFGRILTNSATNE